MLSETLVLSFPARANVKISDIFCLLVIIAASFFVGYFSNKEKPVNIVGFNTVTDYIEHKIYIDRVVYAEVSDSTATASDSFELPDSLGSAYINLKYVFDTKRFEYDIDFNLKEKIITKIIEVQETRRNKITPMLMFGIGIAEEGYSAEIGAGLSYKRIGAILSANTYKELKLNFLYSFY